MTRGDADRLVDGTATVTRVSRLRFPIHRLDVNGARAASLGRYSWLAIYFGTGQRVDLADGARWKVKSVEYGGSLCPIVVDERLKRVAMATPGVDERRGMGRTGHYGINGATYGYRLVPGENRLGRPSRWLLVEHEEGVAEVTLRPNRVVTEGPVPMGAVLMCLLLARFGMPGDADLGAPRFRWN
jgi:hypothetical protein